MSHAAKLGPVVMMRIRLDRHPSSAACSRPVRAVGGVAVNAATYVAFDYEVDESDGSRWVLTEAEFDEAYPDGAFELLIAEGDVHDGGPLLIRPVGSTLGVPVPFDPERVRRLERIVAARAPALSQPS